MPNLLNDDVNQILRGVPNNLDGNPQLDQVVPVDLTGSIIPPTAPIEPIQEQN